jgi:hypothetical protein
MGQKTYVHPAGQYNLSRRNMFMKRIHLVGLSLALGVSAFAAVSDGVSLKRLAKEGDTTRYKVKADLSIAGQSASMTSTTIEKVTKVEADGTYSIESSDVDTKVVFGGQEIESPPQAPETSIYLPTGQLKEIKGDRVSEQTYRMAILGSFITPDKPVSVGDTWAKDIAADSKTGVLATKATYKVVADEKVGTYDTLKIEQTVKETTGDSPASSTLTVWINKADGTMVKLEGKWVNAPFPGSPVPGDATITITREGL